MPTLQQNTVFSRSVYRDFSLFALAAIGVGLAASLTLATAIVLAAPSRDSAAGTTPQAESPRLSKTRMVQASGSELPVSSR
jgi:hypothetical protein